MLFELFKKKASDAEGQSSDLVIGANSSPEAWTQELLYNIDWRLFESLCAAYLASKDWEVQVTELGPDDGVDILFNSAKWSKPNPFGLIQCKARPNWKVPVTSVRELYGVMADKQAELGIYITTGEFSQDAINFAKGKRLQLVNGLKLLELITSLSPEVQRALLEKHIAHDYAVPSCPKCGQKMVERQASSSGKLFWGCASFPKCYGKLPKRLKECPSNKIEDKHGYCIRTGTQIPFNLNKPLSAVAYKEWSKFRNPNFTEKFCHYSGEPSNGGTSFAYPVLRKNWDKAKRIKKIH